MFDSLSMIFLLELEDQPMGKVFALEFVPEFIESMLKGPNAVSYTHLTLPTIYSV